MVEDMKKERANAVREVKRFCKKFGFTAVFLKGSVVEGRRRK